MPESSAPASQRFSLFGSLPTHQALPRFRAAPPQRAVAVLLALPKAHMIRVLADMEGELIVRMLLAAGPDKQLALLGHLGEARLFAELCDLSKTEAAALLVAMPPDWARSQLDRLTAEYLDALLHAATTAQRAQLSALLDAQRLTEVRQAGYERATVKSLMGINVQLRSVESPYGRGLLVSAFHRRFGVAMCYVDDGPLSFVAADRALEVFTGHRVDGLLIVTNAVPAAEPVRSGVPAATVVWTPNGNNGVLARALAVLAGE